MLQYVMTQGSNDGQSREIALVVPGLPKNEEEAIANRKAAWEAGQRGENWDQYCFAIAERYQVAAQTFTDVIPPAR